MKFKLEIDLDKFNNIDPVNTRAELADRLSWVAERILLNSQIGGTVFAQDSQAIGRYYLERSPKNVH